MLPLSHFVNIDTLGLRRSERLKSRRIKPIYTFLTAISSILSNATTTATTFATECHHNIVESYDNYLDKCFDGTDNRGSILSEVYYTSQANNEVYNLREMIAQPDKHDFVRAMEEEVESMFREKIWTTVPRKVMEQHYRTKKNEGQGE